MLIAILAIIIGFIILTWSADRFVDGAAATAGNLNVPPMLIGLTVVSIGTSAPEVIVSLMAALQGAPELAVGNAIGSNIANIGLVLGITALIAPLPVKAALAKREIPLCLFVAIAAGLVLSNAYLGLIDGIVLLAGLVAALYLMVHWQRKHPEEPLVEGEEIPSFSPGKAWMNLLIGLLLLLGSSQVLVWGATQVATMLGVSELVIGLTIVAIGTSLPELAASMTSTLRGHHDIALGNVIGSNMFNLLAVLPMPGLFSPGPLDPEVIWRDYPVMLGLTVLVGVIALTGRQLRSLGRFTGIVLIGIYVAYSYWLFAGQ